MKRRGAVCLALVLIALCLSGFAKVRRHVFLAVSVPEPANATRSAQWEGAAIILRDDAGEELAQLAYAGYGAMLLSQPRQYACLEEVDGRLEASRGERWQTCIRRQGRWVQQWIERAVSAEVRVSGCAPQLLPLHLHKHDTSWWEVWIPLPHSWNDALFSEYMARLRPDPTPCSCVFE